LIVAAAYSKNATIILTEDLNDGQHIEGIMIRNPFLENLSSQDR
jgi:predicted nucleic acid-binding protein